MSLMKFISEPETAVHDALLGLNRIFPSLTVDPEERIVISNEIVGNEVSLLAGGGSGHEPFAAGFVGNGMLSGAVAGLVFASPPPEKIFRAIRTLSHNNNNAGVLVVIINYTGDRLNFGLAIEEAKAYGIKVDSVVVAEDCSRIGEEVQSAGSRGMCGTCFLIKIAGSMAARSKTLSEIVSECKLISKSMATLGSAVSSCTVPGVGTLFEIASDQVDIGLGIHGEAGVRRIKIPSVDKLLETMLTQIINALNLKPNAKVCVIVNNLGSVSQLEMGVISGKIHASLKANDITVLRMYNGLYMTSLDMAGFQISILNVTDHIHWIEHLDSPTQAPAWTGTVYSRFLTEPDDPIKLRVEDDSESIAKIGPSFSQETAILFEKCLRAISSAFIKEEHRLNELDSLSGDGDAGNTLKRFAEGIQQNISSLELEYPAVAFYKMSKLSLNVMGGSSGALYGILLTAAFKFLSTSSCLDWVGTWKAALDTLQVYSRAKVGDRTMVDVLIPAYLEFEKRIKENTPLVAAFEESVNVAKIMCEKTRHMKPKLGRASYVPSSYITDVDPGAYGVTLWLEAILLTIRA